MGCLCCRGQEGVRPQGFFFKVSSALPHTLLNRVGASLQNPAAFGGFFRCFWSTFFAGVGVCLLSKHTPTCGAGPACRPCPPWGPVPPLRSCGPLGRPICPQMAFRDTPRACGPWPAHNSVHISVHLQVDTNMDRVHFLAGFFSPAGYFFRGLYFFGHSIFFFKTLKSRF